MRRFLPNRASVLLAGVAVFVVVAGASAAATRYVITSKKQIAPAVLRQLSRPGPRGLRGGPGATGATGATGAMGAAGTAGSAGAARTFNASNVTVVNGPIATYTDGASGESAASCPAGDTVISGGFQTTGSNDQVVEDDGPSGTTRWTVQMTGSNSLGTGQFYAQAICAS
jgi:hypothetical protein